MPSPIPPARQAASPQTRPRIRGSKRLHLRFASGAFALVLLVAGLTAWVANGKVEERRSTLDQLVAAQMLKVTQAAQSGRIIADLVFGEMRQAFAAINLPMGEGMGTLRQESDYYEYLYGRPGQTKDVGRLMTGNLLGLVPAAKDPELPRLQRVMQQLFEHDLNIYGQPWAERVAYTYWMAKDQMHAFSVARWDFGAAIAGSPQKTAKSAMGELAAAMLTPYPGKIQDGTEQVYRTDAWIDSTDGRALQTMVSPIFDAKGEWLGNAAVDFSLAEIDKLLGDNDMQQAQWLLVTQNNTLLARHVDPQGPLAKLLWGMALSAFPVALPAPLAGQETVAGDYRVRTYAVPGGNLQLYLLMPQRWIYQDQAQVLLLGAAALLLLLSVHAVVWRRQARP